MADLFTKITAEGPPASSPYEFSSITVETDNTFAPSTDQAHSGSYSYKAYFGGSNDDCYGRRNYTALDTPYVKFAVYIDSSFAFSDTSNRYLHILTLGTTRIGIVGASSATPNRWRIHDGTNLSTSTTNFSIDAWHVIEIEYVSGSGSGIFRVWIDGTLIHEYTNLTLADSIAYTRIGGYTSYTPVAGSILYFDDIEGKDAVPVGTVYKKGILFRRVVGTTSILKKFMFIKRAI